MPLKVLPVINQNSTRAFLDLLVRRWQLKPGFRQVLAGKNLQEVEVYLLQNKLLNTENLAQSFAQFYQLPFIRLTNRPIAPATARLLPEDICRKYSVIAYDLQNNHLYLAVGQAAKLQQDAPNTLVRLRQEKGLHIHLAIAPAADVLTAISKVFHPAAAHPFPPPPSVKSESEAAPKEHRAPPESAKSPDNRHQDDKVDKKDDQPHRFFSKPLTKEGLRQQIDPHEKEVDLSKIVIPKEVLSKIPYSVAKKYKIIVYGFAPSTSQFEPDMIKAAAVHPDDLHVKEILNYIEQRNKVLIHVHKITESAYDVAIRQYPEAADDLPVPPETKTEAAKIGEVVLRPEDMKQPTVLAVQNSTPASVESTPVTMPPIVVPDEPLGGSQSTAPGDQTVAKPANSEPISVPEDGSITLSPDEIVNRPSAEQSNDELQRLAREQQNSLEDQNLDQLLKGPVQSIEDLGKVFRSGFIPEIVAATLFLAIQMKASDVHIEAAAETVRIRFRIDGILHDIIRVPHFLHAPLISRIKILSKMKIDEQRIPQDGRFDVVIDKRQVDLRVSTLPTVHGEKIVMRLLDKSEGVLSLEKMGVTGTNFDTLIANIDKPYGIILATGPTGSGKSTTLYAILSRISKPGVNIITLEDPVEYELPGLNQAQVKPQIGFTFAEGLRSVLRQDPNVIMVGEIRDLETAAMATHAALTGHLVLSTLHTNDASGALPRLINMGVEPFLITSSINAVVGQRLVRRVCDQCREKTTIPPAVLKFVQQQLSDVSSGQLKDLDINQLIFYRGKGCSSCTNGYKGRIGIFEVLAMTEKIEELAVRKAPASEIKKQAIQDGMMTMTQDGLLKALKGITTIDEVMRVTTTEIKELPQ